MSSWCSMKFIRENLTRNVEFLQSNWSNILVKLQIEQIRSQFSWNNFQEKKRQIAHEWKNILENTDSSKITDQKHAEKDSPNAFLVNVIFRWMCEKKKFDNEIFRWMCVEKNILTWVEITILNSPWLWSHPPNHFEASVRPNYDFEDGFGWLQSRGEFIQHVTFRRRLH